MTDAALRAVCAPVEMALWYERHVERWSEPRFGLSFLPGRRVAANTVWEADVDSSACLAPETVASVDPAASGSSRLVAAADVVVGREGTIHAIAVWLSGLLTDGVHVSAWAGDPEGGSGRASLLPIDPPVPVAAGQRVDVSLRIDAGAQPLWTWRVRVLDGDVERASRRHSTFHALLLDLEGAAKEQPDFVPTLSARGRARLTTLRG